MPQIYETINLFNKNNGITPYRYIGSDQYDNELYYGSNTDLLKDINDLGTEYFEKRTIKYFDDIDNKLLRKKESEILKKYDVKHGINFYNKTDLYAPGGGIKGMKHSKTRVVSEAWRESRRGWQPSKETRNLWKKQRTGRKATEETKVKMSKAHSGKNNPNALFWEVTDPTGKTHSVVGLRKWCIDNGYNYNTVYEQRAGFKLVKYGKGKGGPNAKK